MSVKKYSLPIPLPLAIGKQLLLARVGEQICSEAIKGNIVIPKKGKIFLKHFLLRVPLIGKVTKMVANDLSTF